VSDGDVVVFPHAQPSGDPARRLADLRDAHLDAFRAWLHAAQPSRDDAEFEAEMFAAAARQMAQLYSRAPKA